MFNKRFLFFALVVVMVFSFTGCTGNDVSNNNKIESTKEVGSIFPMTVTDSYGRQVKLDKEPQKVISVAPNITEIIFAINKSSSLIGRTEYCDFPEEAKSITSIGSLQEPNIEKIAEMKPDLVIASTHFKKDVLQKLEELGIKVVVFYGEESFEGVYDTIDKVGTVMNAKEKAEGLVSQMKADVKSVLEKVYGKSRPSVYYVVSFGKPGNYTAGKDTFIGRMIEMAGGRNAADDVKGWSYSMEKLVEKNPEIMICSKYYDSKKGLESTNGYKDLDAVKKGSLYEIDNNLLDRQGPRLADGLTGLARIIHPEAFK